MLLLELLDTSPKTLFVSRPLLNVDDIREWAKDQGFASTLPDGDMHVTIAFSKQAISWQDLVPEKNRLIVRGGKRTIKQLGDNKAITLCFPSRVLHERWQEFRDDGASWNFPSYLAHITISYKPVELATIEPYSGDLIFGHEKFKEIDDHWQEDIEEDDL